MNFGERVKALRIGLKFSQVELSEKTRLTLRTIQRIENNEVKPSLNSIKVIGKALQTDFSEFDSKIVEKPYEINFTIKITDMNQFMDDLKLLVKKHWKVIFLIVLVVWLLSNYTDLKAGIMEGWNGK
jgi:hypothetical protein